MVTDIVDAKRIPAPRYIGKAEYCYANSAAMLLAQAGNHIKPEMLEVGAGIGLSAFLQVDSDILFFSPLAVSPDVGLTRSLKTFGFNVQETSFSRDSFADGLVTLLAEGPVLLGPLDMGYLLYNPERARGADHFVLAYESRDGRVYIHDPAGYPNVSLTFEELLLAWAAQDIAYKQGPFHCWYAPKIDHSPSSQQASDAIWDFYGYIYTESTRLAEQNGRIIGTDAMIKTAEAFRTNANSRVSIDMLIHFQLPLAAKRANDYAEFFEHSQPEFSRIKRLLAAAFGDAQSYLAQGDLVQASDAVARIAEYEDSVSKLF